MIRNPYTFLKAVAVGTFNNIHLRMKLLLLYGTLIVFSVSIVGIFSYNSIQKYIYTQATQTYMQTLEQINMNIEARLNIFDEVLGHVISDKTFVYALAKEYESPADYSYEYLDKIMKIMDIKDKYKNIVDIIIYKNNSTLPEDGKNLQDIENLRGIQWFNEYYKEYNSTDINDILGILNTKLWIVTDEDIRPQFIKENVKSEKAKPEKKIAIIKPIMMGNDRVVGIIEVYIDYNSIFGEFNKNNDRNSNVFILDQAYQTIFDRNTIESGSSSIINTIATEKKEQKSGSFITGKADTHYMVMFQRGDSSKWIYYFKIPMANLLSSAKEVGSFTVLVAIISILVSFILGIMIARIVSSRIYKLSKSMDEVENLELDVEVTVDGKDEIGNLARSFNRMIKKIQKLVKELETSQYKQRQAELKALQSQINPHFLYNTLSTINWMALDGENNKIISMVENLAIFYRLSLNKGKEHLKIQGEIDQIKAYGDIQKIRLEDRIQLHFNISEDILQLYTVKLILQPFVENSILHGLEYKKGSTTNIVIRGYRQDKNVIFEIIDDGVGMKSVPSAKDYPATVGYGIRNVHEKIHLQYGEDYGVQLYSRPGIGMKVSISIPVIEEDPNEA